MDASLFHSTIWKPFASYGVSHTLLELNAETITYTWIGLIVLTIVSLLGRWAVSYPTSVSGYMALSVIKSFYTMVEQSLGRFVDRYFFFIASLFTIIFVCNGLVLIPGLEEPTQDLNTTVSFAFIAFFYAQKETFLSHGIKGYFFEYFKMPLTLFPSGPITITTIFGVFFRGLVNVCVALLSFPLEILGKVATIISLSLRLFGNIFGGSVITGLFKQAASGSMITQLIGILSSFNIGLAIISTPIIVALIMIISLIISFFFGLFEAFIQAFVFSVLSLTYLSLGAQNTEDAS
jgi:F-type H+-transporting ATPase subunit a